MYGRSFTWGHDSVGVTETSTAWVMAEGCTGEGFETWILVQNPGTSPVNIEMYFLTDGTGVQGPVETIPVGVDARTMSAIG